MPPEPIRTRQEGALGRITLARPEALNALNLDMIHHLAATLRAWRHDPSVETVLLDSTSPRAFCAGGDIRAIRALLHERG